MPHAPDLPQLLHVHVQALARASLLVAHDRARGLEAREAIEAVAAQEAHDRRHRERKVLRDPERAPALVPGPQDLPPLAARQPPGQVMGAGGAIRAAFLRAYPPHPFPDRAGRHAAPAGDERRGRAREHPRDGLGSSMLGEPCILVDVH